MYASLRHHNPRTWLWTCALLLACRMALCGAAAAAAPADLVFLHGRIYTADAARSWASAVAVRGERIIYVGTDAAAGKLVSSHTRVVDLGGRMLLPGIQDSHVHPTLGTNPETQVELDGLRTREALRARISEFAREHPRLAWITGHGWDEAAFLPSGRPTRSLLDDIVPDRPVFLINNSGHQAWANSAALSAAKITAATPQPANGEIVHDASGEPTGSLQEAAMELVSAVIPPPSPVERIAILRSALARMNGLGITAVVDALARPEDVATWKALRARGALTVRAHLCQYFDPAEADDGAQIRRFVATRSALRDPDLQADCVKVILDGGYGSHTVALLEPYRDDPAFGNGRLFVEPGRLAALVEQLDALDFNVHIHAIGDRTVRTALDAIDSARRANGRRDTRHTLAHLSLIDPADLPRFRRLAVTANMTPLWSRGDPWETVFAPRMFGEERAAHLYRTRSLIDQGAVLVWGSDWPVTGFSPLEGLETAVTHRYPGGRDPEGLEDRTWNPEERLNLGQALQAYTAASAWLVHDEERRGVLAPGRLADLAILDRDLFETPPLEIHAAMVVMTVLGGRIIHELER